MARSVLVDDRGVRIEAVSLGALDGLGAGAPPSGTLLARRLRAAAHPNHQHVSPRSLAVATAVAVVTIVALGVVGVRWGGRGALFVLVIMGGLGYWIKRRTLHPRVRVAVARSVAAEGWCGQCAYPLPEGTPEGDGCVVCPECGAAWRAARMTVRHWGEAPRWDPTLALWMKKRAYPNGLRSRLHFDDRGRFAPFTDSRLRRLGRADRSPVEGVEAGEVVRVLRRCGRWTRRIIALLIVTIAGALVVASAYVPGELAYGVVSAAVGVCVAAGVLSSEASATPPRIRRAALSIGRCPVCVASLAGTMPDGDGYRVCGGCGASWAAQAVGTA